MSDARGGAEHRSRGETIIRVTHEHAGKIVEGAAKGLGAGMTLLVGKGLFFSHCPSGNVTTYNGLLRSEGGRLSKTLDRVALPLTPVRVINRLDEVEVEHEGGARLRFRLLGEALIVAVEGYTGDVFLDLDVRRLDDDETQGRIYNADPLADGLLVTYTKVVDARSGDAYRRSVAIIGAEARRVAEWQERHYPYDARRGETPSRWVWRAAALSVTGSTRFALTESTEAARALADAREALRRKPAPLPSSDAPIETTLALRSLDSLLQREGLLAGLPWFVRPWSRDELISVGALLKTGRLLDAKMILLRWWSALDKGRLHAIYPSEGLIAADALGWLAKRTDQLLDEEGRRRERFLSKGERRSILDQARLAAAALPLRNGLVINGPCETWMDTVWEDDGRSGCRAEIQAGTLALFSLIDRLDKPLFGRRRHSGAQLLSATRRALLHDRILLDGIDGSGKDDVVTRPNVFIAHYLFPALLSPEEWTATFDHALERLWLPWGGLATIEKGPLFVDRYSGADNRSYHRGDSWYWVNAVAALSLSRVDRYAYEERIRALRHGCVEDLLFHGAAGHCSELSSAASQEWGGTFCQAWSAALLSELLLER